MRDLIFALGVLAAAEGLVLALAPGLLREALERVKEIPPEQLRLIGLVAATIGVALLYVARGMG